MKWLSDEGDSYCGSTKFYCLLELGLIWFGPCRRSDGERKKIIDLWRNTRTVYESCPLCCQIFSQLTLPCCAGWNLVVQKNNAENNKCQFLKWKEEIISKAWKKKEWLSPVKCHDSTIYVYWRCENSAHNSTVQLWKANVYLFRREIHKCMKCSLHMYPTTPPPCPQERNYLFICLLV